MSCMTISDTSSPQYLEASSQELDQHAAGSAAVRSRHSCGGHKPRGEAAGGTDQ